MKGIIEKTARGWIVKEIIGEGPEAKLIKTYPLHPSNVDNLEPCVLGEYGKVEFEIIENENFSRDVMETQQVFAKLATPMLDRLRVHLYSITPEQFVKEFDEVQEWFQCDVEDCKHCAEDTFKVWECCGMEECMCKKEAAIDFAKWIAKEWMSMWVVDKWLWECQIISDNKELIGYKTEEELYELYLKSL